MHARVENGSAPPDQEGGRVRKISGPWPGSWPLSRQLPAVVAGKGSQIRFASRQNGPDRRLLPRPLFLVRHLQVVLDPTDQILGTCLHPHHGVEVDIAIGKVEGQQPALGQLRAIAPEGFTRQQVNWYGIGREDVEHDKLIILVRGLLQPETRVAGDDVECHVAFATI